VALIDGAGRFRIYWRIIVPLGKPAMIMLAVFLFIGQ
jgi:multiple sugar transport system permease protein